MFSPKSLAKQVVRRNRNWSYSSGSSLTRADSSRWSCKKRKRMKSLIIQTTWSVHCVLLRGKNYWVWSIQTCVSSVICPRQVRYAEFRDTTGDANIMWTDSTGTSSLEAVLTGAGAPERDRPLGSVAWVLPYLFHPTTSHPTHTVGTNAC